MARIDRSVGWLADKARTGSPSEHPGPALQGETLSLEAAFPGAIADPRGCLAFDHFSTLSPPDIPSETTIAALLGELRLVYGIGRRYAAQLREDGYASISELCSHPRWEGAARALLEEWGAPPDLGAVCRSLDRWLPSADPLHLRSLGLAQRETFLFFDLETLGLSGAPMFLSAIGRFAEGGFLIRQYLAPSLGSELSILERMEAEIRDTSVLVSYNGKSFDWTILKERFAYYGIPIPDTPIHVDLLHHARRAFGAKAPDCHLSTIEEHVLGVERTNDLPSAEVPNYYTAYLETGNAAYLVPIVNHSRQDLSSLVVLLARLLRADTDA